MQRARSISHEPMARVLERFRVGPIAVDEGITQAQLDVRMHFVADSQGRLQTVEAAEVVIETDFLFERGMQSFGDFLVHGDGHPTAKLRIKGDISL